jgi:desampylase
MEPQISSAAHAAMIAHAAETPDIEVCGLLLGHGLHVAEAQRCDNVSGCPADSFEIDPLALIAAHKAQRAGGLAIIGHYHSHPNGVLTLSERDKEFAAKGDIVVIVANGRIGMWVIDDRAHEA